MAAPTPIPATRPSPGAGTTLSIVADDNLGAAGSQLHLGQGTTLNLSASATFGHAITIVGDPVFTVTPGQTDTITGAIADGDVNNPGVVEVAGGGTLVLDAHNTYSGGTTIEDGSTKEPTSAWNTWHKMKG